MFYLIYVTFVGKDQAFSVKIKKKDEYFSTCFVEATCQTRFPHKMPMKLFLEITIEPNFIQLMK